ncbi:ABC transporter permease [Rhodocyclus tenuis]|uniref:Putative ABC transport system permease protein n=1 Tax=Rhodocyclus tenuis TaxID=1066 RepID=A0A840G7N2_RHOTE|nr:FtsX-like permease family protein [Rhodocyclus tenuis]MBB4247895.1 putative ABC transport system permease protein [Rhodocyclus tenuis]
MTELASEFTIATRNLRRNTKRSFVAVMTVAGGVIAYVLAGGFIAWVFQDMREATIHSQLGHIQIVRPAYFEKGISDPYSFLLPGKSEAQNLIEKTPGVRSLTPRLAFSGLISLGDTSVPFIGEGIDPVAEKPISSRITMTSGRELQGAKEAAVILGEGLARNVGANTGDTVVILATAANGSPNAVEVKVAGTFATITKDFDDNALRMPIDVARKLMRVDGATSWVALLDRTELTGQSIATIRSGLPEKDFQIVPWSELADFYNKTVVLFSRQVDVVKVIIGLIIILTISNTQTMSVLERTTEIGTSLAIGLRRKGIMRLFLLEGVLIGAAGGAIGVALAYGLGEAISAIGIPMPPPPGMARGYTGQILVSGSLALDGMILALVTTLLASVVPAWKASRMNIVDALRCNQ